MNNKVLNEIENWLKDNRPDYYVLLNPPAEEYLFDALKATAGIDLPDCLRGLYRWHDGQKARTFDPLLMNLTFMTLMEIATTQQTHQHVAMFDRWTEDRWQPTWVPFLSNGGGDYLCLATASFKDIPAGAVLWYDHEVIEREIIHENFNDFLEDLLDRMKTGRLEIE